MVSTINIANTIQLILASIYIVTYVIALLYTLKLNHFKFNKRTKVLFYCLCFMLVLQLSGGIVSFIYSKENQDTVSPLAYALLSQEHTIMMIIYTLSWSVECFRSTTSLGRQISRILGARQGQRDIWQLPRTT